MAIESSERAPLINGRGQTPSNAEDGHQAPDTTHEEIEGLRLYLALIFPMIGLMITALDTTMVSTISATIAADFSSLAAISWLGSAYLVGYAAIQPISGKLTDLTGRRSGYFCALFAFSVGNVMCGLAVNEAMLIAGRAVAGVGGGAISSISIFIVSDLLPLRKRPVWQSLTSVFYAVGMGIGAVFGGLVNDAIGWRWTFMVLLPMTLLLALASYFTLVRGLPRPNPDQDDEKSAKHFDIIGSVLLIGALVCIVLGLNLQEKGQNQAASLALMIVAAVVFVLFILAETWYVSDPVVPVRLLLDRSVTGACMAGFLISVAMHSLIFYVPILIQIRGFTPSQTGLQMLGNPIGSIPGPMIAGVVMRVMGTYAIVKPVAYSFFIAGAVGFFFSTIETPVWATVIFYGCLGVGFGSILTVNLTGLLANIDDQLQASSTGMLYAFRQVGASLGLAISGIIFRKLAERDDLSRKISTLPDFIVEAAVPAGISKQCSRAKYVGDAPPKQCQTYFEAVHAVFLFVLVTAIAGSVFGMLIRNKPLDRGKSNPSDDDSDNE